MKKLLSYGFSFGLVLVFFASCGSQPATDTTATPATSVTTPAANTTPAEIAHATVVGLNICSPDSPEEGEDIGFYMMTTQDEVAKNAALFYQLELKDDMKVDAVTIKTKDGQIVKNVDAKALMGKECAGFLVSKNGKTPEFYPLDAVVENTMAKINTYFK
jgi:hypothetical protein